MKLELPKNLKSLGINLKKELNLELNIGGLSNNQSPYLEREYESNCTMLDTDRSNDKYTYQRVTTPMWNEDKLEYIEGDSRSEMVEMP